jgi:hypothetical protein
MALNELPSPTSAAKLQNTDSRFRPDIRLMEMGNAVISMVNRLVVILVVNSIGNQVISKKHRKKKLV